MQKGAGAQSARWGQGGGHGRLPEGAVASLVRAGGGGPGGIGADGCAGMQDMGKEMARPPPDCQAEAGEARRGDGLGKKIRRREWDFSEGRPGVPQVGPSFERGALGAGAPGQDQVSLTRTLGVLGQSQ